MTGMIKQLEIKSFCCKAKKIFTAKGCTGYLAALKGCSCMCVASLLNFFISNINTKISRVSMNFAIQFLVGGSEGGLSHHNTTGLINSWKSIIFCRKAKGNSIQP